MRIRHFIAAVLIAVGGASSAAAAALGVTNVTLSSAAVGLGLTPSALGTASLSGVTFSFPISAFNGAVIEHDGAGASFAAGGASIAVGNFDVDTALGVLFGDVVDASVTPLSPAVTDLPLFDLGVADASGAIPLLITSTLSDALDGAFMTGSLTGVEFGRAVVSPAPIPLPAAAPLLLGALGLAGLAFRRR
jgi:hypothetical protein